jgi:ribonuclease PH
MSCVLSSERQQFLLDPSKDEEDTCDSLFTFTIVCPESSANTGPVRVISTQSSGMFSPDCMKEALTHCTTACSTIASKDILDAMAERLQIS